MHRIGQPPPQSAIISGRQHFQRVSRLNSLLLGVSQRHLHGKQFVAQRDALAVAVVHVAGVRRETRYPAAVDLNDTNRAEHGDINFGNTHLDVQPRALGIGLVGIDLRAGRVDPARYPPKSINRLADYGVKAQAVATDKRQLSRWQRRDVRLDRQLIAEREIIRSQIERGKAFRAGRCKRVVRGRDVEVARGHALVDRKRDPPRVVQRLLGFDLRQVP